MIDFEEEIPLPIGRTRKRKRKIEDMAVVNEKTTKKELKNYTLPMLKEILGSFGLDKKGKKGVLMERILAHVKSSPSTFDGKSIENQSLAPTEDDNVIGIPDCDDVDEIVVKIEDDIMQDDMTAEIVEDEILQIDSLADVAEDEFPELQKDQPPPDALGPKTKRMTKAYIALLIRNNVSTCTIGFVAKPFFHLYKESLHNRVGFIKELFSDSPLASDRERSYRGNGVASLIVEPLQR
jgi:hypothetical protein